ncbi:fimbrillin family protein [Dysgonomonas sp. Marseille-P4677]|uniref:fimbrillin family protein n=1 Tax=Dysgonomonas sp. Marseille-P4677 TaxID=2364790 RepID=UPI001913A649|nr:fimbrillin family protein [Dysgonomonas sp. Marseille-P4677]MBK5720791.1 fimbrillin family protein [Dysgonomonas sp. Marseille-P4677]
MKTTKLFTATLILALAFTACSNNDEEVDNSRKEVKIVATIDASTGGKTKAAFDYDGSGEFEEGDILTLCYENPTTQFGGGVEYKIGSSNLYWDVLTSHYGDPLVFSAWYPSYSGSGVVRYKVAGAATEAAKDLLMAPKVTVAKGNPVNLQFKHLMHKLTIYLGTNYYSIDVLQNAVITLKNLKSDAKVNFSDCTVDETAAEGTDPYPSVTGSNAMFIVAPQTLTTGDEMIEIQIDGETFTYKVPATLTALESGKHLEITLMLTRYGIEFQTGTISAWGDQGTITEVIRIN